MPIISGNKKGGGTPPPVVKNPPKDFFTAQWVDPSGQVWDLTDDEVAWLTDAGIKGFDSAVDVSYTTSDDPRGGANVKASFDEVRTITLPFRIEGSTHAEFTANRRAFTKSLTRTKREGPGQFIVRRPDGSARSIRAYYASGIEESGNKYTMVRKDFWSVSFMCPDGYWQDLDPVTFRATHGTASDFLNPYPQVSSSQTLGTQTYDNEGDAEAWFNVLVTGPCSSFTFTNETTGESWTMTPSDSSFGRDLAAGEQVSITQTNGFVEFVGPDDDTGNPVDWEASIDWSQGDLWPLEPGVNTVSFAASGDGDGTSVDLSFYQRYETA